MISSANYETWLIWKDEFEGMKFGTKVTKYLLKELLYKSVNFHGVSLTAKVMLNVFIEQVDFNLLVKIINDE